MYTVRHPRPWLIWRIYAAECTRQSAGVGGHTGSDAFRPFRSCIPWSMVYTLSTRARPGSPRTPDPGAGRAVGFWVAPVRRGRGPLCRRFASPMPFAAHAALGAFGSDPDRDRDRGAGTPERPSGSPGPKTGSLRLATGRQSMRLEGIYIP